jgi:hypothetical protein
MAVLLIDNCLSHITSDMIAHLTEVWVRVVTVAPYTT